MIPSIQARPLFTQAVIAVYRERISPMNFLRSFFMSDEAITRFISIEVQRGAENVAVDVYRNTEGNRNTFGKSTQKVIDPAMYREFFDLTQLDLYDKLFGSSVISEEQFAALASEVADKLVIITDKIERAYELQCSQVLLDGIVQLKSGGNINYGRKAASLVDAGGGNYWTSAVDPNTILGAGAKFIREVGKSRGPVVNVILGSEALSAFLNNSFVKDRGKFVQYGLDMVVPAQRNSVGASFHGEVSVDSYRARLWSYPEVYNDATTGDITSYVDPKKIIVVPEMPKFKLAFGAVPQLLDEGAVPQKGAYVVKEFRDERQASHIIDVQSAGIAVPVAVDQIYTAKVIGG